jgi:sugar phosphate isomerase/epimerase
VRLAFSTLGAPSWDTSETIAAAAASRLDGIEWRLVDGALVDGSFAVDRATLVGRETRAAGLAVAAVGSSLELAAPPDERGDVLDEAGRLLAVAQAMGAEFLRVFPGAHPPDVPATEWLRATVLELAPAVRASGVRLAFEVHDSRDDPGIRKQSCSAFLRTALHDLPPDVVGILWDVANPYLEGETAELTWRNVEPMLLYLHVKDMRWDAESGWRYVHMGEGSLPLGDIFDWLGGAAFDGWVSFEWERFWEPALDAPEIALPRFVAYMRRHLGTA